MTRLLPFWQAVFATMGVEVGYVLCCRNPLSVARSLEARNGFSRGRSLYLWWLHQDACLADTAGRRRVVVDYDRLLDQPRAQLRRIARTLALPCGSEDGAAFEEYCTGFLDNHLRHARFTAADLSAAATEDGDVRPEVAALYRHFLGLANDTVPADAAAAEATRWRLPEVGSALALAACFDRDLTALERTADHQAEDITRLKAALEDRERRLAAVYTSTSWRVTAPLRTAIHHLRHLKDGLAALRHAAGPLLRPRARMTGLH